MKNTFVLLFFLLFALESVAQNTSLDYTVSKEEMVKFKKRSYWGHPIGKFASKGKLGEFYNHLGFNLGLQGSFNPGGPLNKLIIKGHKDAIESIEKFFLSSNIKNNKEITIRELKQKLDGYLNTTYYLEKNYVNRLNKLIGELKQLNCKSDQIFYLDYFKPTNSKVLFESQTQEDLKGLGVDKDTDLSILGTRLENMTMFIGTRQSMYAEMWRQLKSAKKECSEEN